MVMALLDPSSCYDLASIFHIPTNFIPDEEHLHDFNLLPPPQPPLFHHHHTSITTPPDSHHDIIHFHHPVDHFLLHSDLYSHHHHHHQQLQDDYLLYEPPPKRHKSSHYPSNCTIPSPPPPPFYHFSPDYANTITAPDLGTFNAGYHNKEKDSPSGGGRQRRPTPQSIAARERRKRISHKTRELARLLPGAPAKTNTADMLHNAFAYVKFLQAQVHLLQLMDDDSSFQEPNLRVLSSSAVQEKLYTNHKCLVPMEFVTHLAQDLPHNLAKELTQFIAIHSTL